ncbi:MAG: DNA-3-methyladenine glycosylase 2 family protein, partial [Pseudomonadota bacterium]|nr:DNA-3-methyladenine glycosylase 2 family protein [Pseudomonadota bacterium]
PEYWERAKKILRNNDPVLSKIISATPNNQYLTINKKPFETLANAIIGQQISVMAAASILRKLNSKIPSISAKNINKLHHMTLKSCGLSKQKILYLKILSNMCTCKPTLFTDLKHLSNSDIIDELTKLKGIGEWTAQMYLIFQLNRQDVVPMLDIGFINSFKKIYKINDIKSKKSEQILQSWKPYSTVAVWYIWRVIDPDVVQY